MLLIKETEVAQLLSLGIRPISPSLDRESWGYQPPTLAEQLACSPEWEIIIPGYNPRLQADQEVFASLANGALGFRGSISTDKNGIHHSAFYRAGLYEKAPPPPTGEKQPSVVADLVCLPDILDFNLNVDGEDINLDQAEVLAYQVKLNLRQAYTIHQFTLRQGDKTTQVEIIRFADQSDKNVVGIEYSVKPLDYSGTITLTTGVDGRVDNKGTKYLSEHGKGAATDGKGIFYAAQTRYKGAIVSFASDITLIQSDEVIQTPIQVTQSPEQIYQQISISAERGQRYTLQKRVVVTASRDQNSQDPIENGIKHLAELAPLSELFSKHAQAWDNIWKEADIQITGDEEAQKYIRYCIAKLNSISNPDDYSISAAAKGLDNLPGEGYMGHVFWDTEMFMLPAIVHSRPEVAKAWLMYRYNTLPAAKEKARKMGYKGAFYSWESADNGSEETPEWVKDEKGHLIPIHTGKLEKHISADIAYAICEYMKATNDQEFLGQAGVEMLAETARFWVSAANYNSQLDRYVIRSVIGPDEYHEGRVIGQKRKRIKPGVHNNTYTNLMARWNIQKALELWETQPQLRDKMNFSQKEILHMRDVAEKMYLLYDPGTKLYEQFEGFHNLKYHPLVPGIHAMDQWLKEHHMVPVMYQNGKQPDAPFALDLLRESDPATIMANYQHYIIKNCSSGSSLSDGAIVEIGARAGISADELLPQWKNAATIDLKNLIADQPETGRSNGYGGHAASWGGTIQAALRGFGGLDLLDDRLKIDPNMPSSWDLRFRTRWDGQPFSVRINRDFVELTVDPREISLDPPVEIAGQLRNITRGRSWRFSLIDQRWIGD